MKIHIVSVGREKADPTVPLVREYLHRLQRLLPVTETILRPPGEDRLREHLHRCRQRNAVVVALDERGTEFTSAAFSTLLSNWMNAGTTEVMFLIGGAEGLPSDIVTAADSCLALSRMTLPHRLARLLLVEQIYRGLCILKNIPYHK